MKKHEFINSNPAGFDSNCTTCGGKARDAIHHLTANDCPDCFASKKTKSIIDVLHPETGRTVCYDKTLDECRKEYPDAEKMTVAEFCDWKSKEQRTPIKWEPTTEGQYDEMLCVLPPAMFGTGGFLVGEPYDHDAGNGQPRYQAFLHIDGKPFVSSRPMTCAEFKTEIEKRRAAA